MSLYIFFFYIDKYDFTPRNPNKKIVKDNRTIHEVMENINMLNNEIDLSFKKIKNLSNNK